MSMPFRLALFALLAVALLGGCAVSQPVERPAPAAPVAKAVSPAPAGPRIVAAVLPLGLSERTAKLYPKLLDKSVGLGMHNVVLDSLMDSGRFRFVEEKPEVMRAMIEQIKLSATGMLSPDKALEFGRMLGAEKVVYGEVFDYAEGGVQAVGFQGRPGLVRVGVQIVCADVETAEKVALGTATATGGDYGEASRKAVESAAANLVARLR